MRCKQSTGRQQTEGLQMSSLSTRMGKVREVERARP